MIYNKTTKKILAKKHILCTSFWCQFRGLMFSKQENDTALVFVFSTPRKISLHMFFVFYPIDVLLLDERKKVIEVKEALKPFHFYFSKNKATSVVEVPSWKKKKFVRVKDVLSLS